MEHSSLPSEIWPWLHKSLQIASRIRDWAKKLQQEPLSDLLQRYIVDFVAKFDFLAFEILSFTTSHQCLPQDVGTVCLPCGDIQGKLRSMSTLLPKLLYLIDFYNAHDKTNAQGALNALLAEQIMSDEVTTVTSRRERVKMGHFGRDFKDLLTFIFSDWQTGPLPPDLASSDIQKRFQDFLQRNENIQWPRYVHRYTSLSEVPYKQDHSVLAIRGSDGVVRKVICRTTGEALAQKSFQDVYRPAERKKIMTELGFLELCQHKNLISLVDAYSTDEDTVIHFVTAPWAPLTLLKFVQDSDTARKRNCPWFSIGDEKSERCITRIMLELADAVAYLHRHSIKHKDIKLENILMHEHETLNITPILTDVGVSKVYLNGGPTNYTDSTYQYLAPEQVKKESSSLKADVWQLGFCFAMLLTTVRGGQSAVYRLWDSFENDHTDCTVASAYQVFMKVLQEECGSGTSVQHAVYDIVKSTLHDDWTVRPDIVTVCTALQQVLDP